MPKIKTLNPSFPPDSQAPDYEALVRAEDLRIVEHNMAVAEAKYLAAAEEMEAYVRTRTATIPPKRASRRTRTAA